MKAKLVLFYLFIAWTLFQPLGNAQKISILYDNYLHRDKFQSDWGFSCIIDFDFVSILFDTGTKKNVLVHNLTEMKENLNRVDLIVISHNHQDHTGNLFTVLEANHDLTVYMPYSTPEAEVEKIKNTGAKVVQDKKPRDLGNHFYLTGEMGETIKEQALIMDTPKGLVIITGCAHPGISEIVSRVKELHKKDIYLVLGGFHLGAHSEQQIEDIIRDLKDMGVRKVAPTHCTGDKAIEMFEKAFGEDFIRTGVGKEIKI